MKCSNCKPEGAIVLLSGGQDSTTALYWALQEFEKVKTISINYGQRHKVELYSAINIADMAGVDIEIINIEENILKGGFLLQSGEIPSDYEGIAPTFVPARNLLFLTIAANRAYIEGYKNIVIGVSQVDYSGYPDCRHETIIAMEDAIRKGLGVPIKIHTPFINLSKAGTVLLAQTIPGCMEALAFSHTCYNGEFPPCGKCPACLLREKGFLEAGVTDPLMEKASLWTTSDKDSACTPCTSE